MNRAERAVRRIDRFQQRHPTLAFPFAVVQKFGNDRAGALATRIAYHGLFSLLPLLLLLTTILGFFLDGHPHLRSTIVDSALADFPIIGTQLRQNTHPLTGSGTALAVGIAGTLYGAFGVGRAAEAAMNSVWNIPYVEWPNFFLRRLRAVAAVVVIGVSAMASGYLTAEADVLAGGVAGGYLARAAAAAVNLAMFTAAFLLLTARPLRWRDVWLGAALATVFWQGLQLGAAWYVERMLRNASDTYGFFAIVIALLSLLYLAAQLTLLAVEINVVRRYRLWPRSMTQPPLTDGDRRTFDRLARMATRRPEYTVHTSILTLADDDPLEADDDAGDDGAASPAGPSRSGREGARASGPTR